MDDFRYNYILTEENDKEFESLVEEYMNISEQLETSINSIKDIIAKQTVMKREVSRKKNDIIKYLKNVESGLYTSDTWVAKLREESKYKRLQPSYKELYEELLTKVNEKIRNIAEALEMEQVNRKRDEKTWDVDIEEATGDSIIDGIYDDLLKTKKSFYEFTQVINELPSPESIGEEPLDEGFERTPLDDIEFNDPIKDFDDEVYTDDPVEFNDWIDMPTLDDFDDEDADFNPEFDDIEEGSDTDYTQQRTKRISSDSDTPIDISADDEDYYPEFFEEMEPEAQEYYEGEEFNFGTPDEYDFDRYLDNI